MVVALGPGRFYGSSLPRPRFYENPNGEQRVDPPLPVLDPLMSWAEEAHWSMGGLSFKRLRLQGRIEGNVKKLIAEREKMGKKTKGKVVKNGFSSLRASQSPAAPAAPLNLKRKMRLVDEDEEVGVVEKIEKRGPVRKLDDDFDKVAEGGGGGISKKLKRLKKGVKSNTGDKVSGSVTMNVARGTSTGDKVSGLVATNVVSGSPRLKKGVKSATGDKESGSVTRNVVRASPRLKKSGVH